MDGELKFNLADYGEEALGHLQGSVGSHWTSSHGHFTHAIHAFTPPVKVINTVGAGDSTIAGFLSAVSKNDTDPDAYGVGFDVAGGIAAAVQWGAAKVQQPTSGLKSIDNLVEATVDLDPDRDRPLGEPAQA